MSTDLRLLLKSEVVLSAAIFNGLNESLYLSEPLSLINIAIGAYVILQEYEAYRTLHLAQKAEKEEIERRREAAIAMNAPAQRVIDGLKQNLADKNASYRDIVC